MMTLEDYIDLVAEGKKPWPNITHFRAFGICNGNGNQVRKLTVTGSQSTKGVLEFYYNGELNERHTIECQKQRTETMHRIHRKVRRLSGEKYFIWKPGK